MRIKQTLVVMPIAETEFTSKRNISRSRSTCGAIISKFSSLSTAQATCTLGLQYHF